MPPLGGLCGTAAWIAVWCVPSWGREEGGEGGGGGRGRAKRVLEKCEAGVIPGNKMILVAAGFVLMHAARRISMGGRGGARGG